MTIRFNSRSPGWERGLSNFAESPVIYDEHRWITAEHAYQAAKSFDPAAQNRIDAARSAADAKKLGRSVSIRPDWEQVKREVMKDICRSKFALNPALRKQLLGTGAELLVHTAPWDSWWGDGRDGNGRNELGRILMELREELK
jgi:hypothetical protein